MEKSQVSGGLEDQAPSANIFVSYAADAGDWGKWFLEGLDRQGVRVESRVLDPSKSTPPQPTAGYAVFVALITPEYVANTKAGIKPFDVLESAAAKFVAVHLQRAPWQELPWMTGFTVLPLDGRAVQDAVDPQQELAASAEFIRMQIHWAKEEPFPTPDPVNEGAPAVGYLLERFRVNETVHRILSLAARKATEHSSRAWLDTRRLFLAIASAGRLDATPQWTGDWLLNQLREVLPKLEKRPQSGKGTKLLPELEPPVSSGVGAALERASEIASRTSLGSVVRTRHLFVALLTDTRGSGWQLPQLLADEGINVPALLEEFYFFVRDNGDEDAEWARILLGEEAATRALAHFDADESRGEDFLDVRPDVLAFAGLIAARTLTPPLSIGLFGEWGAGKTFFMRMLRREVDRLAQQADASSRMQRDLPFWKRIIQIEFNAWHYAEGNLWASLVQHIFENLRFADEPRLSASQELQRHLLDRIGHEKQAEQQARREKEEAERLVARAQEAVASAQQAYEHEAGRLAELSAKNLLADIPVPAIRDRAAGALQVLGLDRVGSSAVELRAALGEARTLLDRGRAVAAPVLYGPDRRRRAWFLVMALFAGPAVAVALRVVLEGVGPRGVESIAAWSAGVATFLSSVTAWVHAQLAKAGEWIQQVEDAQRQLDEKVARAQAQNVQQIREAEERLRLREADYHAARRREEEAQRRAVEARQRLSEASLAGVLSTFIEDRASSTDYRKHLGTLALVRNDFERLSALIEEENWRLSPAIPGEDTTHRGLAKFATIEEERADRARRINRIVLYIDDLDRCPPVKVVEVLQAVHLLLAFPLFVVVVGVDARWITRSLEARYRELLSVDARGRESDEFPELFGSATAHDYLEKIFQVPFWLRPMSDAGARAMVGGLLAPSRAAGVGDAAARAGTAASPPSREARSHSAPDPAAVAADASAPPTGHETAIDGPVTVQHGDSTLRREEPDLSSESLEITEPELQFMDELAPLLGRSPRALKRFVNVYRLVKAGLPPHERRAFLRDDRGASDYQAVLFLLAVDTGTPHIASRLFHAFTTTPAPDSEGKPDAQQVALVRSHLDRELNENRDWLRVRAWLETAPGEFRFDPPAMEAIARWVPRISRFSFHTGRISSSAQHIMGEASNTG